MGGGGRWRDGGSVERVEKGLFVFMLEIHEMPIAPCVSYVKMYLLGFIAPIYKVA